MLKLLVILISLSVDFREDTTDGYVSFQHKGKAYTICQLADTDNLYNLAVGTYDKDDVYTLIMYLENLNEKTILYLMPLLLA